MNSYRIIEVSNRLTLSDIYGSIVDRPFSDSSGFVIHKKRSSVLEGSHLYKKVVTKIITDIEGNKETLSYHDYIKTNFKVINVDETLYIIVINPPRESRAFNQDLIRALPQFTSLKTISKKPIDFYHHLVGSNFNVQINEIEINNINIKNKGIGRFIFTSDIDIYNEAMSFVEAKQFDIRQMIMKIEHNAEDVNIKCKINSCGVICMSDYNQKVLDVYLVNR